jgi:enoyl-CoA hydratase/carnithine racemase
MEINNRIKLTYKHEHIAIVSLNRADKFNALDIEMMHALVRAKKILMKNKKIRVIILTGQGEHFSTGLDFTQFTQRPKALLANFIKYGRSDNLFQRCAKIWKDIPIPVIAAIHGNCYGGALQIAMGADFRFARHDAQLSILEIKWGIVPDMSAFLTMPGVMRADHFLESTMTGKFYNGQEAQEIGLVTRVVEGDPLDEALGFAQELLRYSPDAHAATKKLMKKVWNENCERRVFFWESWYQSILFLFSKNHKISINNNTPGRDKVPFRNRVVK